MLVHAASRGRFPVVGSLGGLVLLAHAALGQASFRLLGPPGAMATSISSDGRWICGSGPGTSTAFRWSQATGFQPIVTGAPSPGWVDIADGGAPVSANFLDSAGDPVAGLWTPSGVTLIGASGGPGENLPFQARRMNDAGTIVVGMGLQPAGPGSVARAFVWARGLGAINLGAQGGKFSLANAVSSDGRVVVGWDAEPITGIYRPARWVDGVVSILGHHGEAVGVSRDGQVVTGLALQECFRWTASSGLVSLGKLPGTTSNHAQAVGFGISDDGNTIVGSQFGIGVTPEAFLWTPGTGMVQLKAVLFSWGATNVANFDLTDAVALSGDGRTIVGRATSASAYHSWIATLP